LAGPAAIEKSEHGVYFCFGVAFAAGVGNVDVVPGSAGAAAPRLAGWVSVTGLPLVLTSLVRVS
jgi:hypothetical protein